MIQTEPVFCEKRENRLFLLRCSRHGFFLDQTHAKLHVADAGFTPADRAVERKIEENTVTIDLDACLAATDWAVNPYGLFFHALPLLHTALCVSASGLYSDWI